MSVNVTFTVAAVDLHAVDQSELDEVEPQLGIDHVAEGLETSSSSTIAMSVRAVFVWALYELRGMY